MDNIDNIYALHALISNANSPVTKQSILDELQCSTTILEQLIKDMRTHLNAPITFDSKTKAYSYDQTINPQYELPGLWFNASELYGLFASYQLLSEVGPGVLESQIAPIKEKLESLLESKSMQKGDLEQRIRILKMAARKPSPKDFSVVATALLMRKQINMTYAGRDRDKSTERIISPQRLVHYRDNWYVDAWCHLREQLRTFAVDRIKTTRLVNIAAIHVDEVTLDEHYKTSYGIFSGTPTKKALLKFNASVAKWVAEEQWHVEQNGQFNLDGSYELEIPYRDARELIQDILKFGPDVEVLKPEQLRNEIKKKLEQAIQQY